MRKMTILAGALVVALVAAGCGQGTNGDGDGGPTSVDVTLDEWSVSASPSSVDAGEVELTADNEGDQPHELVVIETDLAPDELPEDGPEVDEDAEGLEVVDEIEEFDPGETESMTVDLEAGDYVLVCNLPAHYSQGMYMSFEVQ